MGRCTQISRWLSRDHRERAGAGLIHTFSDSGSVSAMGLMNAEEPDLRASWTPTGARIPEFHAVDYAPVTRQIDDAGLPARRNSIPNLNCLRPPVTEMDHHAVELNRSFFHTDLDGPILSPRSG